MLRLASRAPRDAHKAAPETEDATDRSKLYSRT
jgi:hypothetical protein